MLSLSSCRVYNVRRPEAGSLGVQRAGAFAARSWAAPAVRPKRAEAAATQPSLVNVVAAAAAAFTLLAMPLDATAAQRTRQPPVAAGGDRCAVTALDLFAEVGPPRCLSGRPAVHVAHACFTPKCLPAIEMAPIAATPRPSCTPQTRAKFSQEASGGNMAEAVVDVRDCDFSNMDLSGKVGRLWRVQKECQGAGAPASSMWCGAAALDFL
jgi:hypothetical protein